MTTNTNTLGHRILQLVELAQSRRAFARMVGVNDVAVMGWEGGSIPYERTLNQIAAKTGVSLEWLRDGRGDEKEELRNFKKKLASYDEEVTTARVFEESGEFPNAPMYAVPPAHTPAERHLELAASKLDGPELAGLIESVLKDPKTPAGERRAAAARLTWMLLGKLQSEHRRKPELGDGKS